MGLDIVITLQYESGKIITRHFRNEWYLLSEMINRSNVKKPITDGMVHEEEIEFDFLDEISEYVRDKEEGCFKYVYRNFANGDIIKKCTWSASW